MPWARFWPAPEGPCTAFARRKRSPKPSWSRHEMASAIWVAFAALFLAAAVFDGRSYRIPNWISAALVALFVVAGLASGESLLSFWPHVALGAGVLLIGYLLYLFTGMGAGDAKLGAAAA